MPAGEEVSAGIGLNEYTANERHDEITTDQNVTALSDAPASRLTCQAVPAGDDFDFDRQQNEQPHLQ